MISIELVHDRQKKTPAPDKAKALVKYCLEKNLIILACGTYGNVIRFLMPLVITDEQLEQGMQIVDNGLTAIR
jgi:4-aminobutyrate aminotransferase/(S)-3-amino-2-methylpropionate transaminase